MSDAMERLWVWLDLDTLESSVSTAEAEGMTEYIRADIHDAEVARLREALEEIADPFDESSLRDGPSIARRALEETTDE